MRVCTVKGACEACSSEGCLTSASVLHLPWMLAGFLQLSWLAVLAARPDSERIYQHMLPCYSVVTWWVSGTMSQPDRVFLDGRLP